MSEIQTFDETLVQSITNFANELFTYDDTNVCTEFLIYNVKKAVNALDLLHQNEYREKITKELLRLIQNIFLLTSPNHMTEIINCGLYKVYKKMVDCLTKDGNWDDEVISRIFISLTSLGCLEGVRENVNNSLIENALVVFEKGNFLLDEKLNDDSSIGLYDTIIGFLYSNSKYSEGKKRLIELGVARTLLQNVYELNRKMSVRHELKYIKLWVVVCIAYLLTEEEMEQLPISNDIVDTLLSMLRQAIENADSNQKLLENTKFYFIYIINKNAVYVMAKSIIGLITKISVNDLIKEKLFDFKTFDYLNMLIEKGNDDEVGASCELICSLCFISKIKEYLRTNERLIKMINAVLSGTTNVSTKRYCQQIIHMINPNAFAKRVASAKVKDNLKGYIMISYSQPHKDKCLQISEDLKKRGYVTWMDTQQTISDVYEPMAKAIENASIIVICFSEEYKESVNCRYEASYASQLNKEVIFVKMQPNYRPDGWLGSMIASKLYVDVTKTTETTMMPFDNLIKHVELLKSNLQVITRPSSSKHAIEPVQERPPSRNIRSAHKLNENPAKWSLEEAKSWFRSNNLSNIAKLFPRCTGITLKGLYEYKQKDYIEFNNSISKQIDKEKIELDLQEKMDFYELLQRLFSN